MLPIETTVIESALRNTPLIKILHRQKVSFLSSKLKEVVILLRTLQVDLTQDCNRIGKRKLVMQY